MKAMDENFKNDKVRMINERRGTARKLPVYEGFEYYKTIKDMNGFSFNHQHLMDFSRNIKYKITILRKVDKKTCLYNYFVENEDLKKFFKCCFDGKIEGEIIEIEKYNPENLA